MAVAMTWGETRRLHPTRGFWRALCAALAAGLCLASAAPAQAQNVDSATGTGRAIIVAPLTLVKARDMSFGRILPSAAAGTVVVSPATGTCTVSAALQGFGGCRAAQFVGMGTRRMRFRVTLPAATTLTGPGAPMTLDTFTLGTNATVSYSPNGNGNGVGNQRYTIETASGIFDFTVGGTLHVNANQAPGLYNGTFDVTVIYN